MDAVFEIDAFALSVSVSHLCNPISHKIEKTVLGAPRTYLAGLPKSKQRLFDEPLWSAASRSSNREPSPSGMAVTHKLKNRRGGAGSSAQRERPAAAHSNSMNRTVSNRAGAPVRLQIRRAQLQYAIKHYRFKLELFRKWSFVRYRTDWLRFRSHFGLSLVRPTHSWRLRVCCALASAWWRERRRLFSRALYDHRTKHFGNHKIKRNLQDGLRTCLLDFPERGE